MVVLVADVVLVIVSWLDRFRAARVQAARREADRVQRTVPIHSVRSSHLHRHRFEEYDDYFRLF